MPGQLNHHVAGVGNPLTSPGVGLGGVTRSAFGSAASAEGLSICTHIYTCTYIYIPYMYVFMYMYIYIYIYAKGGDLGAELGHGRRPAHLELPFLLVDVSASSGLGLLIHMY